MADIITTPTVDSGFYSALYSLISDMFNNFMKGVSEALVSGLQPVLLSALTIYFMCKAWSIMYGRGDQQGTTMKDLTMQVIKMAFVVTFFCNAPNFYNFFIDGLYSLDSYFIKIIKEAGSIKGLPSDVDNAFKAIDSVYYSIVSKAEKALSYFLWGVDDKLSFRKVALGICLYLIFGLSTGLLEFCAIISTFIAFIIVLTNTLGLAFLMAFGPFFGSMLLFPQTKELFTGWLKVCLNFIFTKVFVAGGCFMMISLCDTLFKSFAGDVLYSLVVTDAQSDWQSKVAAFVTGQFSNAVTIATRLTFLSIVYLCFGLFFAKCPGIATSIVGGMQMGGGKTAEGLNDKVTSGVQAAGKAAVAGPAGAAAGAVQTGLRNGAATALKGGHMRTYRMLKSLAAFGSRAPKPSKPSKS